jgi:multisubunit Na+/H+ antiporter MnhB subunit
VSATSSGLSCGIVLGIVVVLLLQQFGYLDLTSLSNALVDLIIAMVIGAVLGALIGWVLGRHYLKKHPDEAPA